MQNPKLNWRPGRACAVSPPARPLTPDVLAAQAMKVPQVVLPSAGVLDLRQYCPAVDNQEQLSDCVADATCASLEFIAGTAGRQLPKLSRLFVYYNARLQVNETGKDEGTYVHLAFSSLETYGTCMEETWAYDTSNVFVRPPWAAYQQAYPNRIASFYSIPDDDVIMGGQRLVGSVKQALLAQRPVVFGMTVDADYQDYAGGVVAMPRTVRPNPGGHCQLIVGFDDNRACWLVQNSWGSSWGEGGFAWLPYAYVDVSAAADFWVPTAA